MMARSFDAVIVGGGPAGLATATALAQSGLSAVVLEKRSMPADKACGEGLLPPAVRALEALGVRSLIEPGHSARIASIRFVQEDGTYAEAALPCVGGLGLRRLTLSQALMTRAQRAGAEVRERCGVLDYRRTDCGIEVTTSDGTFKAAVLVAADGLNSRLRCAEGLDGATNGARRFGMRCHFRVPAWTESVEVHFAPMVEAYVTPVSPHTVGVAFLWDQKRMSHRPSFASMLGHFPDLSRRLGEAAVESRVLGAGPLAREALAQLRDRFVLVGDAAGYVDAITGEGLSLAFQCALTLGRILPGAIARGVTREALLEYEREFVRHFRLYRWRTRAMLFIARRVAVRRRVLRAFASHPRFLETILRVAIGRS
jgi:menaquinone-9 beta-reductase